MCEKLQDLSGFFSVCQYHCWKLKKGKKRFLKKMVYKYSKIAGAYVFTKQLGDYAQTDN